MAIVRGALRANEESLGVNAREEDDINEEECEVLHDVEYGTSNYEEMRMRSEFTFNPISIILRIMKEVPVILRKKLTDVDE